MPIPSAVTPPDASHQQAGEERPVDLAQLARQTMGNRDLEREVLHLFIRQSETYLDRLAAPDANVAELAHVILGSARGIGAVRVARAAERLELSALAGAEDIRAELNELRHEVEIANTFIRSIVYAG